MRIRVHTWWKIGLIGLLLFFSSLSSAQQGQRLTISGVVFTENHSAFEGCRIDLLSTGQAATPINRRTVTDLQGKFSFADLPYGTYEIHASAIGFHSHKTEITLNTNTLHSDIRILMLPKIDTMVDVIIFGKSQTQQAKEQAVRAVVIDIAKVSGQPANLSELMNRSPGIRIRQSGGLGNAVDISINGFQGNSVQYFKDGIPLEYLGGGYGINNVPINLLERVEVYKGVVPVSLGGDALGGAVNLVSRTPQRASVNLSYEVASFNTHIAHIAAYQPIHDKAFVSVEAFYNYADNDYKADVQIVDQHANPVPVTVPLFHNGYRQYFAEIAGGFKNTAWTDELKFALAHYDIARESQHPALMTNAYGALMSYNQGWVPSVRYRKKWLDGILGLDQFATYSRIERSRIDTVKGTFDWLGNFYPRDEMGESPRRSRSNVDFGTLISRTNIQYRISNHHQLEANLVFNQSSRTGSDPYGLRFAGTDIDVLSKEALYRKAIAGLSYESKWLDDRLTNQSTVKYFYFMARGINGFLASETDLDDYTSSTGHNWGLGNAIKYVLDGQSFVRASLELTNRLPREAELFGDSDTRAPNFQLEPERSFNANLGYSYTGSRFAGEVGIFYRKTKGMILLVPVQPPFAQYQNLDSIRGYGFDIDLSYRISKSISFNGNLTWQDNRMVDIPDGLYKWIEGTRLRNTPFFFANAGLTGHFTSLLSANDGLKPYLHWNYIREFYLNHIPRDKEPQGFLGLFGKSGVPVTNRIPDQHLMSAGFNYYTDRLPLTLGLEVKNIFDTKLYDYYKIQRPGRSFHLKLNYTLSLNK